MGKTDRRGYCIAWQIDLNIIYLNKGFVNTRIGFMLALSLLVPVLSLLATNTHAQTLQTSGGLNNLTNSNITSTTRIVSFVDNVTVTKFSIISPDKLSVDLRYSAKGDAPSVKVETGVINIKSKSVSQLPEEVGKLLWQIIQQT